MSRINTNVTSLISQHVLRKNNDGLNKSLSRLSTGLKINSGADDPAGLIASENLRLEKTGLSTAINNAERASNIIGTAEGGLSEVSSLLNEVQSLIGSAANSGGSSAEETQANQLQVDSILNTINRIAGNTSFQGAKLLNGNYDYTKSGVNASAFKAVSINAARLADNTTRSVVVQVTNSATLGQVQYSSTGNGLPTGNVTIEIQGNTGAEQFTFAGSSALSAVAASINAVTDATGVTASAGSNKITFKTEKYGSDQFVSVRAVTGTFAVTGGTAGKAKGTDAKVNVNGAAATVHGVDVTYRSADLDVELELTSTGDKVNGSAITAGSNQGKTVTFGITGGGANFSLASKVTESAKASVGIQSVNSSSLGDNAVGFLSSLATGGANSLTSGNLSQAQKILDKATKQVSQLRGRLGAFQKFTIGSTINSLGVALENSSAAESAIRDTDFAEETANLTRSQILSQAASTVLAQANAAPQAALQLLR